MKDEQTRLFFTVEEWNEDDQVYGNKEIFQTLEEADAYALKLPQTKTRNPRIEVCIVRHSFREEDGGWNYDDFSDTFETVKVLQ